ncbi:hypothetical protein EVAR_11505_1 [Eumeta japonica]|uniref:Uncharacterized protein n=1 Tax=Eumeta variegata TaxID=151549 RepID=A0A4C1TYN0_EUMVA|nr:hypothetical protein EVAR_11505_1 [Eumeta japonica]
MRGAQITLGSLGTFSECGPGTNSLPYMVRNAGRHSEGDDVIGSQSQIACSHQICRGAPVPPHSSVAKLETPPSSAIRLSVTPSSATLLQAAPPPAPWRTTRLSPPKWIKTYKIPAPDDYTPSVILPDHISS